MGRRQLGECRSEARYDINEISNFIYFFPREKKTFLICLKILFFLFRVKDRELEESEERHQAEIKVYKQKVKHLLYEQEQNLAELRAENMVSLKVVTEEHQRVEMHHLGDKRGLQEQLQAKDKQVSW